MIIGISDKHSRRDCRAQRRRPDKVSRSNDARKLPLQCYATPVTNFHFQRYFFYRATLHSFCYFLARASIVFIDVAYSYFTFSRHFHLDIYFRRFSFRNASHSLCPFSPISRHMKSK